MPLAQIWLNPMFGETGFVGDPNVDCDRVPLQLPPRISVVDDSVPTISAGGVTLAVGGASAFVDYLSVLPPSEF